MRILCLFHEQVLIFSLHSCGLSLILSIAVIAAIYLVVEYVLGIA